MSKPKKSKRSALPPPSAEGFCVTVGDHGVYITQGVCTAFDLFDPASMTEFLRTTITTAQVMMQATGTDLIELSADLGGKSKVKVHREMGGPRAVVKSLFTVYLPSEAAAVEAAPDGAA